MQTAQTFWDKTAEKYSKSPIKNVPAYEKTMERTRSYLSENDSVLELGCGTGSTALLLADAVKDITASDISANMIGIARNKAADQGTDNVTFVQATPTDGKLPAGPFDAVLAFNFLHLLEDVPGALRAVHQRLKPGGVFISKTPCLSQHLKFRLLRLPVAVMRLFGRAPYVDFLTFHDIESIIEKEGFQIIEAGNFPNQALSRFIVARKV